MRGPTKAPFRKAFGFAAAALGLVALLWALGTPSLQTDQGVPFGRLIAATFVPAAITGFLAYRAKSVWGLGRIGAVWLLNMALFVPSQFPPEKPFRPEALLPIEKLPPLAKLFTSEKADPLAARKDFLAGMRKGFAKSAPPGTPNLIDLLAERFPADTDKLMAEIEAARKGPREAADRATRASFAGTLVAIQARDGAHLATAPSPALRALLQARRDVLAAVIANGTISCTATALPPTPEIARLSLSRTYSLLAAIAEGRDHPVARPVASDTDYIDFALEARRRGIDIGRWKAVSDPTMAQQDPERRCSALISIYETALAIDGALSERLLAGLAKDQLTTDVAVYAPVLK